MMRAIAISRQLGSEGTEIAQQVSLRLGWALYGRELINLAAKQAGVPAVALSELDEFGFFGLKPTPAERKAYQVAIQIIMNTLADKGNVVILGRGGQAHLHDRDDVLKVRIISPAEVRIERLTLREGISYGAARSRIEASDRSRARYLRATAKANIDSAQLYHLVLNTAIIDKEAVIDLLCRLALMPASQAKVTLESNP
jgi:cytidylate kinase